MIAALGMRWRPATRRTWGAELVVQCAGGAAGVPAPVEPVYGAPGREGTGQGPPHAAVMGHIADGVDDVAPMMRFWPATSAVGRSRCWQRLQQRPFGIGGVGGVAPGAIGRDRRRRCGRLARGLLGAMGWCGDLHRYQEPLQRRIRHAKQQIEQHGSETATYRLCALGPLCRQPYQGEEGPLTSNKAAQSSRTRAHR